MNHTTASKNSSTKPDLHTQNNNKQIFSCITELTFVFLVSVTEGAGTSAGFGSSGVTSVASPCSASLSESSPLAETTTDWDVFVVSAATGVTVDAGVTLVLAALSCSVVSCLIALCWISKMSSCSNTGDSLDKVSPSATPGQNRTHFNHSAECRCWKDARWHTHHR